MRSPHYVEDHALRPGRVTEIRGVIFQSDGKSTIGRLFIRPFEALDRWVAGVQPSPGERSLAMHTGIHVVIDGEREYVVEQLVGSFYMDFRNGLNWTPYHMFRDRDRGGWDATLPAEAFRGVDSDVVQQTLENLNAIEGHPFIGEDCAAFVERAFGNRRLFADSPFLRRLGISVRLTDPALPLLKPEAEIAEPARTYLQVDKIKHLPDAAANVESPNVRLWAHRAWLIALVTGSLVATRLARAGRRPLPERLVNS